MPKERVVITGMGTVNAVAHNVPGFRAALSVGRCGIGPVSVFDTSDFRTHTGAQVPAWQPRRSIPRALRLKRLSRADTFALAAACEALADAGCFPFPGDLQPHTGVVIGGGAGGMLECEALYGQYLDGRRKLPYSAFAAFCCASSADQIAIQLGLQGPKTTFMTACSSGATAIGYARDLIASGAARMMVCGGTEPLCRITYGAFNALQAVDPTYCKPFDRDRQGLSLGEGAGILVLESLTQARERGATIQGEVLGYGLSCDAHHMTSPEPSGRGAVLSMQAALSDAGLSPADIDYINAHGTATPANDRMETAAIKTLFGKRAHGIPVSSIKSMIGHTLSAAGAIEGVASVLALRDGLIPPTVHHTTPDAHCDLDYVREGARHQAIRTVLSNSFAFGGNNTTVVFGRWDVDGRQGGGHG